MASAPLLIASAIAWQTRHIKSASRYRCCDCVIDCAWSRRSQRLNHVSMDVLSSAWAAWRPDTYEAYGTYGESGERFAEVLEILTRCWSEEALSFEEKFHRFDNVTIVPRPFQKPYRPLRIAATRTDTDGAIGAWACLSSLSPGSVRSRNWVPVQPDMPVSHRGGGIGSRAP